MALAFASCWAPMASMDCTKVGMPVGMAETAIEMPSSIRASKLKPRTSPTTRISARVTHATIAIFLVRSSSCSCSGERVRETSLSMEAIRPTSVLMPVSVITIVAGAPGDRRVLEQHVGPVTQCDVRTLQPGRVLAHRDALPGQGGLLRLERRGLQDASVGRDDVAGLHLHHVPGNQVGCRQEGEAAVAHHPGLRHLEAGQRVDAGARLELLVGAHDDVEQDQGDHDGRRGALADHDADHSNGEQHQGHGLRRAGPARCGGRRAWPPAAACSGPYPTSRSSASAVVRPVGVELSRASTSGPGTRCHAACSALVGLIVSWLM